MRAPFLLVLTLAGVSGLCAAAACSSDPSSTASGSDAGASSDAPSSATKDGPDETSTLADGGADAEEPATIATEVEPNNGTPIEAIGTMALPGTMNGAIDPASDVDTFAIDLAPGEFWDWTATPTGADLAPHVLIFDTTKGNLNPNVVGLAGAGAPATLQHFVLRPGKFVVVVRDARNVGAGGKGGPTYGYALTARRKAPQPIAVTFPTTKTGKLASLGSVDLYTFTGTNGKGWDIVIRAQRKASPSTLNSRLSVFDLTSKQAVATNDNVAGTTDSQLGGATAAPSTYMVIVENEGTNPADLSYEIEFKNR